MNKAISQRKAQQYIDRYDRALILELDAILMEMKRRSRLPEDRATFIAVRDQGLELLRKRWTLKDEEEKTR
jgi:hypothetical protein